MACDGKAPLSAIATWAARTVVSLTRKATRDFHAPRYHRTTGLRQERTRSVPLAGCDGSRRFLRAGEARRQARSAAGGRGRAWRAGLSVAFAERRSGLAHTPGPERGSRRNGLRAAVCAAEVPRCP